MDSNTHRARDTRPEIVFEDGLGPRYRWAASASPEHVGIEMHLLRASLAGAPAFEFALQERVARLSRFHHPSFSTVHGVERGQGKPPELLLFSDAAAGMRLSLLLEDAYTSGIPLDCDAALCILRQLVDAIAALHSFALDVSHGAIAAERLHIAAPDRLLVADHALASALQQLRYPAEQYWSELGVAVPSKPQPPVFDQRLDVVQMGALGVALLRGYPLEMHEWQGDLAEALGATRASTTDGKAIPLPPGIRGWLSRALQLNPLYAFSSAVDAKAALDALLDERGGAERSHLAAFLSRCFGELEPFWTADEEYPRPFKQPDVPSPLDVERWPEESHAPLGEDGPQSQPFSYAEEAASADAAHSIAPRADMPTESLRSEIFAADVSQQAASPRSETPAPDAPRIEPPVVEPPEVEPPVEHPPEIDPPVVEPPRVEPPPEEPLPEEPPPVEPPPEDRSAAEPPPEQSESGRPTPIPHAVVIADAIEPAAMAATPTGQEGQVDEGTSPDAEADVQPVSWPRLDAASLEAPAISARRRGRQSEPAPHDSRDESFDVAAALTGEEWPRIARDGKDRSKDPDEVLPEPDLLGIDARLASSPVEVTVVASADPEPAPVRRRVRWLGGFVGLFCVGATSGVVFAWNEPVAVRPLALGTLNLSSTPAGVDAYVNNAYRGLTPLNIVLPPGAHLVELRGETSRRLRIVVSPGLTLTQFVDLPDSGQPVTMEHAASGAMSGLTSSESTVSGDGFIEEDTGEPASGPDTHAN